MIDDLSADGMFTSSLDADADGREGLTYVWTPAQLREVLGDDDGRWAAELFHVTDGGTFEHGSSVLQLLTDPDDADRFERVRTTLLAARFTRPTRPLKFSVPRNVMPARSLVCRIAPRRARSSSSSSCLSAAPSRIPPSTSPRRGW